MQLKEVKESLNAIDKEKVIDINLIMYVYHLCRQLDRESLSLPMSTRAAQEKTIYVLFTLYTNCSY